MPASQGSTAPSVAERPMRADAQRNYNRLVAAAREAFTRSGSDAALEDVARAAGVGIGTLYRHFPDRLALIEAVYRDGVDGLSGRAETLASTKPPLEALELWFSDFVAYAATKQVLIHVLAEAIGKDSELLTHSRQVITDSVTSLLSRAQSAGVVRADVIPSDLLRLVGGCTMMAGLEDDQQQRLLRVVLDGLRAS
ncbi:MAG: TetR/AcrR family transcriptional regulator [Nocardioidaceae bacterium]